jgi:hypothetical protein
MTVLGIATAILAVFIVAVLLAVAVMILWALSLMVNRGDWKWAVATIIIPIVVTWAAWIVTTDAKERRSLPAPSGAPSEGSWTASARLGLRGAPVAGLAQSAEHRTHSEVTGSNPVPGGVSLTGAPLQGWATFFDAKAGTAAAGPLLRSGDWRGRVVSVCTARDCVTVALTDACACGDRHGKPTLIDLARADFARLAPTSQGVVWVTIGRAQLPATDAE